MSTAQHKTLTDFVELKNRHALTHVVRAANELGVFRALANGQRTVTQLASEIDADVARLQALMDVLVQSELIEQYQDDFALSTLARLIPHAFYDMGDSYWKHLVGHVKTGSSLDQLEHVTLSDQDFLVNQAAEEWTLTPAGMTTAKALDMGNSRKGLNIIELGCGSAVIGATLIHVDPTSKLTLVDTAEEISRARQTVESIEVADQTSMVIADNWRDFEVLDLSATEVTREEIENGGQRFIPQPVFDMVILTRLVHLEPLERLGPLLKKIGALLLARGGEVVIVDVFPGQEEGVSQYSVAALEFGLRHSQGRFHDPRELESMLHVAGFPKVQFTHLPAEPFLYGLMLGEK
ncbi:MAG: hypothetical protein AAFN77_09325 [Planctomycetota bacterium]